MFQKKDYIYSESMGVCLVADVTNLAPKKGNAVSYYVLKSVYQKSQKIKQINLLVKGLHLFLFFLHQQVIAHIL